MRKFNVTFLSEIDQVEIREVECDSLLLGDHWAEFDTLKSDNHAKLILAIPTEMIYRIEEV